MQTNFLRVRCLKRRLREETTMAPKEKNSVSFLKSHGDGFVKSLRPCQRRGDCRTVRRDLTAATTEAAETNHCNDTMSDKKTEISTPPQTPETSAPQKSSSPTSSTSSSLSSIQASVENLFTKLKLPQFPAGSKDGKVPSELLISSKWENVIQRFAVNSAIGATASGLLSLVVFKSRGSRLGTMLFGIGWGCGDAYRVSSQEFENEGKK